MLEDVVHVHSSMYEWQPSIQVTIHKGKPLKVKVQSS